jgi:hypothetical protein
VKNHARFVFAYEQGARMVFHRHPVLCPAHPAFPPTCMPAPSSESDPRVSQCPLRSFAVGALEFE